MSHQSSLKSKTVSGLFWSFTDLVANQGIQFIVQIILARLLLPEQFGLIGMILVFITLSNSIIDSGFTQALIREKDVGQGDYSTVFYFNLFIAMMMYFIIYFAAKPISIFYSQSQLISILRVLSLVFIINSFGIIQRVILIKNVNFKTQTKINIIAGIISGAISIILAVYGFGVWSLVLKTIIMQFIQTFLLWLLNRWVPSLVFNIRSLKYYFGFGSKLLISGLIDTIFTNIYFIIIGKFFSSGQLGYYSNAVKLRDIASQSATSAIQNVTYPILSRLNEDSQQLKIGYKKVVKLSAFLIFPFMIGVATISRPLVYLLFGEKWSSVAIYLELLCLEGMLYPLHAINLNILKVKGKSDIFLYLEVIKKIMQTLLIVLPLLLNLGIIGLIASAILYSYLALLVNVYYSGREISYSIKEQVKDLIPIFTVSLIMGGIIYSIGYILPFGNLVKIVIQIVLGIFIYVSFCKFFNIKEIYTVFELILSLIKKANPSREKEKLQ